MNIQVNICIVKTSTSLYMGNSHLYMGQKKQKTGQLLIQAKTKKKNNKKKNNKNIIQIITNNKFEIQGKKLRGWG